MSAAPAERPGDHPTPIGFDRSEAALGWLYDRAERLHRARIEHDPSTCVICVLHG